MKAPTGTRSSCFNGAGTERSRKYRRADLNTHTGYPLQWGRDRAVPEMTAAGTVAGTNAVLQWGRDRAVPEITWSDSGAANIDGALQWGRDRAVPEMMRSFTAGCGLSELQWGRDRAVPEMRSRSRLAS